MEHTFNQTLRLSLSSIYKHEIWMWLTRPHQRNQRYHQLVTRFSTNILSDGLTKYFWQEIMAVLPNFHSLLHHQIYCWRVNIIWALAVIWHCMLIILYAVLFGQKIRWPVWSSCPQEIFNSSDDHPITLKFHLTSFKSIAFCSFHWLLQFDYLPCVDVWM